MNKRLIHSVVEAQAQRSPDATAIVAGDEQLSFGRLNEYANRLAHALRTLGVQRETVVSTNIPAGISQVIALLAILKAGGVYRPLDFNFPVATLKEIVDSTEAGIYITDTDYTSQTQQLLAASENNKGRRMLVLHPDRSFEAISIDTAETIHLQSDTSWNENPELINEPGDGCYIIATAGDSAVKKAILGIHDSLSHFIHWELQEFRIDNSSRIGQLNEPVRDLALQDIFVALCAGATLYIPGSEINRTGDRNKLVQWINEQEITLLHTEPFVVGTIAGTLLDNKRLAQQWKGQLTQVLLKGDTITSHDIASWTKALGEKINFVSLYGAAETTIAKTFHRIAKNYTTKGEPTPIHAGKPITNSMVVIINDNMLCNVGEVGEIYIATPFLAGGYYKDPANTDLAFVANPLIKERKDMVFKTGDKGRYNNDYAIEITGRLDDEICIQGIRFSQEAIRKLVTGYPGITDATLHTYRDSEGRQHLLCYFTGDGVQVPQLQSYLREQLHQKIVPSYFIALDAFPLTITGKINKKELPIPEAIMENEAPRTELEKKLETICKELLNLDRVSRKVSFFKIGGVSVKVMQYIFRIYKEMGILLSFGELFERNTIENLAAYLSTQLSSGRNDSGAARESKELELMEQEGMHV